MTGVAYRRFTYRRADGSPFAIDVVIDPDKVARAMADRMARNDRSRSSALDGGVVATVAK